MDLYIAIKGPKRGTIYDLTEEGLEEVVIQKQEGKDVPAGYTGLIIPYNAMQDCLIKLARRGQQVDPKIYEHCKH